jgi:pyruvate formate lyase activating enzyme
LCQKQNIELILKTNAYSQIPVWEKICNITSAMNIDWKGTDEQYSNFGIPDSSHILNCIEYAINKTHVEISIPVYFNCSKQEHEKFSSFISRFPNVPIHLLKIYPAYKNTNTQVTSDFLLYKIKKMYKLSKYVYLQNIYQDGYQDTYCSSCFERIAYRKSFVTTVYQDKCCNCTIIRT